ncbi:hypothetical protein BH10ACI4_BH10ACI4_08750 [soil metagenome]
MLAQVFIYGKDTELLKTRAMVLRRASFEVEQHLPADAFSLSERPSASVFVLCNSLELQEQVALAEHLRAVFPEAKILLLRQVSGPGMDDFANTEVIGSDPASLLAACERLTKSELRVPITVEMIPLGEASINPAKWHLPGVRASWHLPSSAAPLQEIGSNCGSLSQYFSLPGIGMRSRPNLQCPDECGRMRRQKRVLRFAQDDDFLVRKSFGVTPKKPCWCWQPGFGGGDGSRRGCECGTSAGLCLPA